MTNLKKSATGRPDRTAPAKSDNAPSSACEIGSIRIADMPERGFGALHRYWAKCRGRRHAVPRKSAIDPVMLPRQLLPYHSIIERPRAPDEQRLYYRLAGSAVEGAAGQAMTGHDLDAVLPIENGCRDKMRQHVRLTLDTAIPVYGEGSAITHDYGPFGVCTFCHLFLPLRDDQASVRFVLAFQTFQILGDGPPPPFLFADTFRVNWTAFVAA